MYYITTSRPYTNSAPHLGTLIDPLYADVYKRFYTMTGRQVFFSMGTDEHSFKIANKAVELKLDTKQYADSQFNLFKEVFDDLTISYDEFMQSSDEKHHFVANLVWKRLEKKGYLYKKSYQGLYCEGCEDFYAPSQLIDGKCPTHPHLTIKEVDEENYFFRLSSLKDQILDYLKGVKLNDNSYRKEMSNFVKDLQDISVSRDKSRLAVEWGVTVNQDPSHVMYVWFEALITYLTPLVSDELYEAYIQGDNDVKVSIEAQMFADIAEKLPQDLQIIGSDNAKFHLVIWSGMLLGLGLEPISTVFIHGMLNDSLGRKFAKSLGNGVTFEELYNLMGSEGVRFAILYYCNSSGDTNFNIDTLIDQFNAIMGNKIGNALMRITTLSEKYFQGNVDWKFKHDDEFAEVCTKYNTSITFNEGDIFSHLEALKPELAFRELCEQFSGINSFLEKTQPWKKSKELKDNEETAKEVNIILAYCLKRFSQFNEILSLFLPDTAQKIGDILKADIVTKAGVLFEKIER